MNRWYSLDSVPQNTSWLDLGLANCQRCSTWRRIYRPDVRPDLAVCSVCANVLVNNGYTNVDREIRYDDGGDEGKFY